MMGQNNGKASYFPELTGVRAIAAYMVFFHHYNVISPALFGTFFHDLVGEFHTGVTVFFVLSGFLIGYRYFDSFEFTKNWFSKYIKNRVARIYPVYFLLTTLTFLIGYYTGLYDISNDYSFSTFLLNITFLRGFFIDYSFTGIAQGWSLTVEECFYLSAPLIFYLFKKYRLFYFQAICILLLGFLLVGIFENINFHGFFSSYRFMLTHTYLGRCLEFFIGIRLAIFLKQSNSKSYSLPIKLITYLGSFGIIICIALIVMVKGNLNHGIEHPVGLLINNAFLPIFIALFFYGLINEKTLLSRFFGSKLLILLGKSSYVFYLIHMGVICWGVNKFLPNNNSFFLDVLPKFIILNLISIFIFIYFEEPLNKFLRIYWAENNPRGNHEKSGTTFY